MTVALVTGGGGFVGGWLAKALIARGATVVSFDRRRRDTRPSTPALLAIEEELIELEGELTDPEAVAAAIRDHRVDTVFHLGAETIVAEVQRSPARGFDSNVRGTWTVLEACRELGVERVVVASSDKAYGAHDALPYREDLPLRPTAPYEASKAAADVIARSYWPSYGLSVAVTRFANVYGGGDLNFSRLIPEAVTAALTGRPPALRSDGSPERDFLYVEDAAEAYLAIADCLDRDGVRGEAFNAGGGRPWRVGDVVSLIGRLTGTRIEPQVGSERIPAGEIDRQYVDAAKIRDRCGWEPRVGLEQGLERTIAWYRDHPAARPAV